MAARQCHSDHGELLVLRRFGILLKIIAVFHRYEVSLNSHYKLVLSTLVITIVYPAVGDLLGKSLHQLGRRLQPILVAAGA